MPEPTADRLMSNLDFKNWLTDQRTTCFAVLRYKPDADDSSSDWDLAVADATGFGHLIQARWGDPDLRIRRQYVEQWYYPWNQVDLLPVFEWNGIPYLCRERFWTHVSISHDGLPRPRPAHDAFIAWMTGILWGGRFRERYRKMVLDAWAVDREEFSDCLYSAFGRLWTCEISSWLDAGEPELAVASTRNLRSALRCRAFTKNPGESLLGQFRHWRVEWHHHRHPPYPWIAFLGPDGSGKSSVINGVSQMLTHRRIGSEMIHWCPPLRKRPNSGTTITVPDPHSKKTRGILSSLAKLVLLWVTWSKGTLWLLRHPRAKSKLLISDRYYDDLLVDPKRYRYGAPLSWARWVFRRMPKPDSVVILTGESSTIHARKQEVTHDELKRQLASYSALAVALGDYAEVICCTQPLPAVIEAARNAIIKACRNRRETLPPPPIRRPSPLPIEQAGSSNIQNANQQRPLQILVSAYACSPTRGAEANVAWNLIRELSSRHKIIVMTRSIQRRAIESSGETWVDQVRWIYSDPPAWLTFWRRGKHGLAPFYLLWHLLARHHAAQLIRELGIDLCHHVTIGTYLMPSPLAGLAPPLVFGPVGGGERTPPGLKNSFGFRGRMEEWIRDSIRSAIERFDFLHHWYLETAWAFAATPETEKSLRRIGLTDISLLPQSANGGDAIERYVSSHPNKLAPYNGTINLITACRLVHWKAVNLAIGAVAAARSRGLEVRLTILEDGPERDSLKSQAIKLGIADHVNFSGRLPSLDDVYDAIRQSHALIHPAVHEAFGQACLESLALGVPVICLDWGGPGMIVDDESGFRIIPSDPETTVTRLADAISLLAAKLASGNDFTPACIRRAQCFKWSEMAEKIDAVYYQILRSDSKSHTEKGSARSLPARRSTY